LKLLPENRPSWANELARASSAPWSTSASLSFTTLHDLRQSTAFVVTRNAAGATPVKPPQVDLDAQ